MVATRSHRSGSGDRRGTGPGSPGPSGPPGEPGSWGHSSLTGNDGIPRHTSSASIRQASASGKPREAERSPRRGSAVSAPLRPADPGPRNQGAGPGGDWGIQGPGPVAAGGVADQVRGRAGRAVHPARPAVPHSGRMGVSGRGNRRSGRGDDPAGLLPCRLCSTVSGCRG